MNFHSRRSALLLGLVVALSGCLNVKNWPTISGSGNVVLESREVNQFDRVEVGGAGELTLVQGDQEGLTIEADDNLLPHITAEVVRGRLVIGSEGVNLRPSRRVHYKLTFKHLNELGLSGSVQARSDLIASDRLALAVSGSGGIEVAQLRAQTLSAHISGSGKMTVAGEVKECQSHISGSGRCDASELKCLMAEAHISGSGHVSFWAEERLNAHISGSGSVSYRGNPQVDSHVSGSGRVRQIGGQ
ncbi:MAG: head GIN domain-containing protein [Verrucomicrobiota bacterium]